MDKITFAYKGRYFVRDTNTIEYLSAIAKGYGYSTGLVYDQDIFGVTDNVFYMPIINKMFSSENNVAKKIAKVKPEYVVFIENFGNLKWIENISRNLKAINDKAKIIIIRPLERKETAVKYDYLLTGEPENVFADFLRDKGLRNIDSEKLADLNTLPLPDKDIFSQYINFSDSYMTYTGKGCAGSCSYCEETAYKNEYSSRYCRRRSPENVISELVWAKKKFNFKEVIFKDSVFTIDALWLKKFLKSYREEIAVPFKCFGKADAVDENIIKDLKNSGCYCIEFGVQTLNEEIRKNVLFRKEKTEQIKSILEICGQHELKYDVDHMFGLPYEKLEDHIKAAEFYSNLKSLNRIKCHNLTYYPKAEILRFAAQSGDIDEKLIEKIGRGEISDFFAKPQKQAMMKENACFRKLFKIMPLMTRETNSFIIVKGFWKLFSYIPNIFIVFLQLILALRRNDLRFKIYFKQYPKKMLSFVTQG